MTDKIKTVHLEGTSRRIDDSTPIVRYMKLETLLLLLFERRAFIPSHATLGRLDRLETGILFDLPEQQKFWADRANHIEPRMKKFLYEHYQRIYRRTLPIAPRSIPASFREYVDELATERCIWCWNEFENYSNALWQLYGNWGRIAPVLKCSPFTSAENQTDPLSGFAPRVFSSQTVCGLSRHPPGGLVECEKLHPAGNLVIHSHWCNPPL